MNKKLLGVFTNLVLLGSLNLFYIKNINPTAMIRTENYQNNVNYNIDYYDEFRQRFEEILSELANLTITNNVKEEEIFSKLKQKLNSFLKLEKFKNINAVISRTAIEPEFLHDQDGKIKSMYVDVSIQHKINTILQISVKHMQVKIHYQD